jgi:fumarate reductase subunit C
LITRLVGFLVAIDAALTLGLGAALWFLVFLAIPIVMAEMLVGVRLLAHKQRWYGAVPVVVVTDYGIGLLFTNGIAAPLAIAYLAVNTVLLMVWLLGLCMQLFGSRQLE